MVKRRRREAVSKPPRQTSRLSAGYPRAPLTPGCKCHLHVFHGRGGFGGDPSKRLRNKRPALNTALPGKTPGEGGRGPRGGVRGARPKAGARGEGPPKEGARARGWGALRVFCPEGSGVCESAPGKFPLCRLHVKAAHGSNFCGHPGKGEQIGDKGEPFQFSGVVRETKKYSSYNKFHFKGFLIQR